MTRKERQAENARRHYDKNKEAVKKRARLWTKVNAAYNRKLLARYKLFVGCSNCGYKRCSAALEFHHLDGEDKDRSIGSMVTVGCSTSRIKAEARKCVVLCANCHREVHDAA